MKRIRIQNTAINVHLLDCVIYKGQNCKPLGARLHSTFCAWFYAETIANIFVYICGSGSTTVLFTIIQSWIAGQCAGQRSACTSAFRPGPGSSSAAALSATGRDSCSAKNSWANINFNPKITVCSAKIQSVSKKGVSGNHSHDYGSIFKFFVIFIKLPIIKKTLHQ